MTRWLPILLAVLCGCASKPIARHGIPELGTIDRESGRYRGGQPNAEGVQWLVSKGITRRLKLNTEAEGSDAAERAAGIEVRYSPITIWQQLGLVSISTNQINAAVLYMAAGPCFVGCEHGQDRTGLVVAVYRVKIEGWTKRQARAEMRLHHFHPWLLGLTFYWWDV